MKTVLITIGLTLATVFTLLAAIVAYEMNRLPVVYSCVKVGE